MLSTSSPVKIFYGGDNHVQEMDTILKQHPKCTQIFYNNKVSV